LKARTRNYAPFFITENNKFDNKDGLKDENYSYTKYDTLKKEGDNKKDDRCIYQAFRHLKENRQKYENVNAFIDEHGKWVNEQYVRIKNPDFGKNNEKKNINMSTQVLIKMKLCIF